MNQLAGTQKEKHEFALFVASLSSFVKAVQKGEEFVIADEQLVHRITTVLRLEVGDTCLFFDQIVQVRCVIVAFIGKKQIRSIVESKQCNTVFNPKITFLLPLLKRDDYEKALYSLAEIGVTTIQLITTKKTSVKWTGKQDSQRAHRILISAAEQSKNFAYPDIKEPISLALAVEKKAEKKIFFDGNGRDFFTTMTMLHKDAPQEIIILIGPEGDLSDEEKNVVKEKGFIFCALTPTTLRSVQAAALSAGFIRSLFTLQPS